MNVRMMLSALCLLMFSCHDAAAPQEPPAAAIRSGTYGVSRSDGSDFEVALVGPRRWAATRSEAGVALEWRANIDGDLYFADLTDRTIVVDRSGELGDLVPLPMLDPKYLSYRQAGDPGVAPERAATLALIEVPARLDVAGPTGPELYELRSFVPQAGLDPKVQLEAMLTSGFRLEDLAEAPQPEEVLAD